MIGVILTIYTFLVLLIFCSSILDTIISIGVLIAINVILKNKKILIDSILYLLSIVLLYISFSNVKMTEGALPQFENTNFLFVALISVIILIKMIVDWINMDNEDEKGTKKKRKKKIKKTKKKVK